MEKKFERKNGTGVLFINEKKTTEKHPNMTGTFLTPDGAEYQISAWTKEGKKGKYLSLSIQLPRDWNGTTESNKNDDLPF